MKLMVWDLVIGLHAAVITESPDSGNEQVCVAADEIDVDGGDDADYRAYQFPDAFLECGEMYTDEGKAIRELQESMVSTKAPFCCEVADLAEAKAVILTALRVRGGVTMNCDGMALTAFRCVQGLVESLDGDLGFITYTLLLFCDTPDATDLPIRTVARLGLSDW